MAVTRTVGMAALGVLILIIVIVVARDATRGGPRQAAPVSPDAPQAADALARTALLCFGERATIVVEKGETTAWGTRGDDMIVVMHGAPTIDAQQGNDLICGGDLDDTIRGGAGSDRIDGARGTDQLYGEEGNDRLWGGRGVADDLDGGLGLNVIHGGRGDADRCRNGDTRPCEA